MAQVVLLLLKFLQFYQMVLIVRIVLSWFPNIDWYSQPFRLIYQATEPVMAPFRELLRPLTGGMGIDFSPIVLFFLLGLLQKLLASILLSSMPLSVGM